ncbi:hypothetical protein EK21DRAFT_112429 [Setomelanomma holmii]|uniref:Uncharacterized protein n=1 Tax=Setomelanomma holmii TaxID=210430 RepID=A0A9P4H804_9PLEO|nr:hypothetical protein EK21DRAFT_112429 [Setomelanomma holmii]
MDNMEVLLTLLFWASCLAAAVITVPLNNNIDDNIDDEAGDGSASTARLGRGDKDNNEVLDQITAGADLPASITELRPANITLQDHGSIQIFFYAHEQLRGWAAIQGPQGVAWKCQTQGWKWITNSPNSQDGVDMNDPSYPKAGFKWPVAIEDYKDCRYESDGSRPGRLLCGNPAWLIYDFLRDPSWDDSIFDCHGETLWHRAWYVEY